MFTLTIKGLWAHKLRYALTGLAVVLGVAFMAGTMVLTDTMERTFNGVFESANEGTDVLVRRSAAIDGEFNASRDRVDAAIVDRIAAVDGVRAAEGSIQGFAQLVKADGTVASTDGLGITIGANWIDDEHLNPFDLSSGRAPASAGEVVMDRHTVEDEGWALGDEVTVLTKTGPSELTLVGTATYGAIDGLPGSTLVATDDVTAQALFAEPGRYDNVVVASDGTVTAAELASRIEQQVATPSAGFEAITGDEDTADKQADLKDDLGFFNQFLMAFAYVALFVGTFIIYNTFSIVVAQRVKDLAMLRAIGAKRGQVLRSVVLEALLVGIVAAGIGLVAGVGLSFGLRALLTTVGLEIPTGDLVIASGTIVTAFAVGITVSVLSALVPAMRASRVRPIAAFRDVAVDRSGVSLARVAAGLAVVGLGVTSFAAGMSSDGGDSALQLLGLGSIAVVLGVFTLGPVLVRPAMRVIGAPASRLSGITGRYARQNAQRTPKRTAATASALMIGVALVGFITILASSTNSSIASAVDRSFRADYVVESGSMNQGFAPAIEDDLRNVSVVEAMSPVRSTLAEVEGSTVDVMGVDTATIEGLYDLEVTRGAITDVHGDGVAIRDKAATDRGLGVGDTVPFRFTDGAVVNLTVRAVYDSDLQDGDWLVGLDTFDAHVADRFDKRIFVSVDDGVSASESRAAIEQALARWPNAELQDQAEFKEAITAEIDQMLNLIYGLLALAIVIALIGIANTLALSIHERTRELGLLRAVGMHRRQLRSAVRWESLLIAVLGAVLGAVLAVGGAWGIVKALDSEGITQLTLPTTRLLLIMGLAGLAGVLAASGPARRAGRLNVLEAISSE